MPSFTVDGAAMMADFIIPMNEDMARELFAAALADERNNYATMAIYYVGVNRESGKTATRKVLVSLAIDGGFYMVQTGDYFPRKFGAADIIVKTDTRVNEL